MSVRVRIAPSPTGNLHIGTARTALVNYLYARHLGGTFVLRVEDTDQQRSRQEYTDNILSGLRQLGLSWDEGPEVGGDYGPYAQSERVSIYAEAFQRLKQDDQVYPCFCTPETIQKEREQAEKSGETYVYSGTCKALSKAEVDAQKATGVRYAYRLHVPIETLSFDDLVRGEVTFNTATLGDFIVARQDELPLYNLAVVIDDHAMKITHVLRGEDHISNTPKQILLYRALGATPPVFGHTPMMLAPDRSKLSKRHGATSVDDYIAQGYLPEALLNYLALLGWSPADTQEEIFTLEALASAFELKDVSKSGAVFDVEKLKWMNGQWIRRLSPEALWSRLQPFLAEAQINVDAHPTAWWLETVKLVQDKLVYLPDYLSQCDFLLGELVYQADQVSKAFGLPSALPVLEALATELKTVAWTTASIHEAFESLKQNQPFKMKEIMWPIRAALSGRTSGADLHQSIYLLGQDAVLTRLQEAQAYIARTAQDVKEGQAV
jgi:glutamyl-tRNA synthetase